MRPKSILPNWKEMEGKKNLFVFQSFFKEGNVRKRKNVCSRDFFWMKGTKNKGKWCQISSFQKEKKGKKKGEKKGMNESLSFLFFSLLKWTREKYVVHNGSLSFQLVKCSLRIHTLYIINKYKFGHVKPSFFFFKFLYIP